MDFFDPIIASGVEQALSNDEQIDQRAGHEQPVRVPLRTAVTHLGETKHPFDHSLCSTLARTLDLVRFRAFSDSPTSAMFAAAVGEVLRIWRVFRITAV